MVKLRHEDTEAELDEVDQLLLRCVESDVDDRAGVLDALCGDHAELAVALRQRYRLLDEVGFLERGDARRGVEPPDRLGDFRILHRLGGGGMGVVYLAEQEPLGRRVALKLLRPERVAFGSARDRFRRECQTLSKLEHPGICPVYEVGEIEGQPYLAMRYLDGQTLAQRIESARQGSASGGVRLSDTTAGLDANDADSSERARVAEVLVAFEKLAHAAHAAHEAGLVHRDLKPANVMITTMREPVLLDFGLVRDETSQDGLTHSGDVLGTPAYLAPEQIDSRRADRRSDVYALGVTLYESLTLARPFAAPTREALYRLILAGECADVRVRNRHVSRDLTVVVATAMDKSPERRYPTALELAEDLRRVRMREPIEARPAGRMLRAWRWTQRNPVLTAFIAFLIAGLSVTLVLLGQIRHEARTSAAVLAEIDDLLHLIDLNPKRREDLLSALGPAASFGDAIRAWAKRQDERGFESNEVEAAIRFRLGRALLNAGDWSDARHNLERSLELQSRIGENADTWACKTTLGYCLHALGHKDRALTYAHEAAAGLRTAFGETHPEYLRAMLCVAGSHHNTVLTTPESFAEQVRTVEGILATLDADPSVDLPRFEPLMVLGVLQRGMGEIDRARQTLLAALGECRRTANDRNFYHGLPRYHLALCALAQGDLAAAEEWAKESLAFFRGVTGSEDNDWTTHFHHPLVNILHERGRFDEAVVFHRDALEWGRRRFGVEAPRTVHSMCVLAGCLRKIATPAAGLELDGLLDEMERIGEREVAGSSLGASTRMLKIGSIARQLALSGRLRAAVPLARAMIDGIRPRTFIQRQAKLRVMEALVTITGELPPREAAPLLEQVLERYAVDELSAPATRATWLIEYGELLLDTDRSSEAEQHFREALRHLDPTDQPAPGGWCSRAENGLARAAKLR